MSKTEKDGKKIATVLGVASTLPLAGTVVAMNADNGQPTHQENLEQWKELDGSTSYFDESTPKKQSVPASVYSARIENEKRLEKQPSSSMSARQALLSDLPEAEEAPAEINEPAAPVASPVVPSPAYTESVTPDESHRLIISADIPSIQETIEQDIQNVQAAPESLSVNNPAAGVPGMDAVDPMPAIRVENPAVERMPEVVVVEEVFVPETPQAQPEAPQVPEVPEAAPEAPVQAQPEQAPISEPETLPEAESPSETVEQAPQESVSGQDDLNDRIAQAALSLVGVTDGMQCTEVVSEALTIAGVDNQVDWPSSYLQYGTVVSDPVAGNLVYYDNGGNGLDHVAVYIGEGQAVHGNFTLSPESGPQTMVYDVYYSQDVSPVYIQVS